MAKKMAVGPDDLRQLTCLGAADHGKLDRLVRNWATPELLATG